MKQLTSILGPNRELDLNDFCYELTQRVSMSQKFDVDLLSGYFRTTAKQMGNTGITRILNGERFPDNPNNEEVYSLRLLHGLLMRRYDEIDDLLDAIKNFRDTYEYCRQMNTGPLFLFNTLAILLLVCSLVAALYCLYMQYNVEAVKFIAVGVCSIGIQIGISLFITRTVDNKMKGLLEGKML